MKEREIEKILVAEVKRLGGRAYKWVSPGNDGVPDRIVIFPQRPPVFVELKKDTGRLSPLQKSQITRLEALGQDVRVVNGLAGLVAFFNSLGFYDSAQMVSGKMKEAIRHDI